MVLKRRFDLRRRLALATALIAACMTSGVPAAARADEQEQTSRWASTIERFEAQDREAPPPKGAILFVGSSSIRMWNVDEYFPGKQVINRGFGGSQVADSVEFADRIVIPHRPSTVVFYAGDNDVAAGKTPEQVLADYKKFVAKIHAELPRTRIIYIAIKPSLARWNLIDKMREANASIEKFSRSDERLEFVDIDTPMLGKDGTPREELFVRDGLHLTAEGYTVWTARVKPHLEK